MKRPQTETVTLNDILITEELSQRPPRTPNWQAQAETMQSLAEQMASNSASLLQTLVDIALRLCQAGTAGVSLLETTADGEELFRWNVLAGTLADYVGGTTPRDFSPCGVCLDCGYPVLFSHTERYFTYLQAENTPIVEALVLPLIADNHALGTIWILSHDEQRHFDGEDVRVMRSLADFTAVALLVNQRQTQQLLAKNAQLEALAKEYQLAEESARESEAYFHAIADLVPDMLWRNDLNGKAIWYNQRWLDYTGQTLEEAQGDGWLEVIHPSDRCESFAKFHNAFKECRPLRHEHRIKDTDGNYRWFLVQVRPVVEPDGCIIWFGAATDIHEQRTASEQLRASEELLQVMMKNLPGGAAFVVDRNLRYLLAEGEALYSAGFKTEDFLGKTIFEALPPELSAEYAKRYRKALAGEPFTHEHNAHNRSYVSRGTPLRSANGEVYAVLAVSYDITEGKQAEAALRESEIQRVREQIAWEEERRRAETLAELDSAKTIFFSNVSHEFRTPLTLLLAPLQDALSDAVNPLTPIHRQRLELAHRNGLRLLKLVNTLLDFSCIEAGRMKAVYEPTDLALLTTELASVFRSAIEQAGLELIVDCSPISEPVYVDRQMWEKIVLNLLSNAFKFTITGEITVRLHLADEHHVILEVEDTGIGIAPEELPHIMKRFYRVQKAKGRTHEGSGIGLALVQELIQLHSGKIEVSSVVGIGTCFTVTIPLGKDHLPRKYLPLKDAQTIPATNTLPSTVLNAAPYVKEAQGWIIEEEQGCRGAEEQRSRGAEEQGCRGAEEQRSRGAEEQGCRGVGEELELCSSCSELHLSSSEPRTSFYFTNLQSSIPQILIVDDNADMRDYLKRILSEHAQVKAVTDGKAALTAVAEQVPDLVVSDVMMPQIDGFELLKALRADTRTKELPIILLSARAGEESIIEGLQAGADDYLIKPFSAQELVTRVLAHLQMAKLRSQALQQEKIISRRKDEFLAAVAHELNTPLVAILGWTRLLRSSPPSQSMLMKSLEIIERNATLQAKLVEDLLDISRITAGKIHLHLQPVQLQQVIEIAIATVRQSLEIKGIYLECQLDPLPTIVQGDPDRLQQIILNLLTNAVKFTPTGGIIEIVLKTQETQAQIVISDTGCGIDGEFLPYIFETFRQASGAKKGLGLGLAIARNLVELHGGIIYAQSSGIGQGASFTVKLPIA